MAIKRTPSRRKRITQPQGLAQLNPKLLSRGLALAWIGSSLLKEGVKGSAATIGAGDTSAPTQAGLTLKTDGSATTGASFGTYQPAITNTWSVIILANPAANSARQTLYSQRAPIGSSNTGFTIGANQNAAFGTSNGELGVSCQDNAGAVFGFKSGSVVVDGKFHVFGIVREGTSGNALIYVDGKLVSSTAGLTQSSISSNQETIIGRPGNYSSDGTYSANCNIAAVLIFNNTALSAVEVAAFGSTAASVYGRMFATTQSNLWLAPTGTISRPNSDVAVSGWVGVPNASLYANVNEATASDAEYIYSPGLSATPTSCTFGLSLPLAAGTYDVGIRAQWVSQSGQLRVVLLDSGGTSVGASSYQALSATATSYTLPVTTTGSATQARIEAKL